MVEENGDFHEASHAGPLSARHRARVATHVAIVGGIVCDERALKCSKGTAEILRVDGLVTATESLGE